METAIIEIEMEIGTKDPVKKRIKLEIDANLPSSSVLFCYLGLLQPPGSLDGVTKVADESTAIPTDPGRGQSGRPRVRGIGANVDGQYEEK